MNPRAMRCAILVCALALSACNSTPAPAPTAPAPTAVLAATTAPATAIPTATLLPTVPVAVTPVPPTVAAAPAPTLVPTQVFAPSPVPTSAPAVATSTSTPGPVVATSTPVPLAKLEGTNWQNFVLRDLDVRALFTPTIDPKGVELNGKGDTWGGYADTKNVIYGDANEDGRNEALIPIHSGGTAGTIGFLLYAPTAGTPKLVDLLPGYKMWAGFERGAVVVTMPIYGGWEPNCCPTGISVERLSLREGKLSQLSLSETGLDEAKPIVVDMFYNALADKRYRDAYDLLADEFRQANPFDSWQRGYSQTVAIELISTRAQPDGTVRARFVATDRDAQGKRSERRYDVLWTLTYVPPPVRNSTREIYGWLLQRAKVEVNEPLTPGNDKRTGTLTGKLQYPSSGIPPLIITAQNVETGARFTTTTRTNQTSWALAVPAGRYVAFAHLRENTGDLAGGYSEYVTCGLKVSCPSHALIEVEVKVNGTTFGVDIADWYAPSGAFPPPKGR